MGRNHGAVRVWWMSRPSAGADAAASRRFGSEPVSPADVGPSWLGRATSAPKYTPEHLLEQLVGVDRLGCLCRAPVVCTRTHAKAAHPRAEPGCNIVAPGLQHRGTELQHGGPGLQHCGTARAALEGSACCSETDPDRMGALCSDGARYVAC